MDFRNVHIKIKQVFCYIQRKRNNSIPKSPMSIKTQFAKSNTLLLDQISTIKDIYIQ